MSGLRGFGTTFDLATGTNRGWYATGDGVTRWVDTDLPVDSWPIITPPAAPVADCDEVRK